MEEMVGKIERGGMGGGRGGVSIWSSVGGLTHEICSPFTCVEVVHLRRQRRVSEWRNKWQGAVVMEG